VVKIPASLLPHRITVAPYLGSSAYGPKHGDAVTIRARIDGRRRVVKTPDGADLMSSATATIRPPGFEIAPESKATWEGREYEVLDVLPLTHLRAVAGYELLLGAA
jgi:hypothetical protein